ncbi:MAG TPA: hypothetical protein VKY37_11930 [Brumimicrobium sp.]|nr:hypothetical protein [Brumimicrobium sp.]
MCNSERQQFIKELKRDIALNRKEIRRQRFYMMWASDKSPYLRRLEYCLEDIDELKSRLQIHEEVLSQG